MFSCKNKQKFIFTKVQDAIRNEFWIDNNTLQLIVPGKRITQKIPISKKRKMSCKDAMKKIKKYFKKKYSNINMNNITTEIRYTLYTEDGTCKLVVWYTKSNLKNRI